MWGAAKEETVFSENSLAGKRRVGVAPLFKPSSSVSFSLEDAVFVETQVRSVEAEVKLAEKVCPSQTREAGAVSENTCSMLIVSVVLEG